MIPRAHHAGPPGPALGLRHASRGVAGLGRSAVGVDRAGVPAQAGLWQAARPAAGPPIGRVRVRRDCVARRVRRGSGRAARCRRRAAPSGTQAARGWRRRGPRRAAAMVLARGRRPRAAPRSRPAVGRDLGRGACCTPSAEQTRSRALARQRAAKVGVATAVIVMPEDYTGPRSEARAESRRPRGTARSVPHTRVPALIQYLCGDEARPCSNP